MEYKRTRNIFSASYDKAYDEVDDFFEKIYHQEQDDTISIDDIGFNSLTYREGQQSYALDIMSAIKNQEILLVQAGVGIGKSFGYLLPIFYTQKNVTSFKKVIISTSSIALQEQLLKDIKKISEMLEIEIQADIAKGINNYACLRRIYYQMDSQRTSPKTKELLKEVSSQIRRLKSSDKADLQEISDNIWERIRLQNRGLCSGCNYSKTCPYYKLQEQLESSNIIITNHANIVKNYLDQTDLVRNVDMLVFDEAHKLEENMQGVRTGTIDLDNVKKLITTISALLQFKYYNDSITSLFDEHSYLGRDNTKIFEALDKLYSRIMASASKNFFVTNKDTGNEDDYSVTDSNRLGFRITPTVRQWLDIVLIELNKLFKEIDIYEKKNNTKIDVKLVQQLKQLKQLFEDMSLDKESSNIYWTEFYKKNRINILYAPKNNLAISRQIFSKQIPIILTSGTMLDENNSYNRFCEGLELNTMTSRTISYGDEQKSPYNYSDNALFYYNPNIANPNNKEEYIKDLALEISELIKATNGKALILFTSKKTMNSVYQLLQEEEFPFQLLLQTDNNATEVKEHFKKDTNSCLFATGAFWEGIDIKGKSLSNLIITRLPFEQVDAVTQYKASKYDKSEQFRQVYFPSMLTKFKQAVGRLIRSDTDTGIVCCLDSRVANYIHAIAPNIPIETSTTDKKELYQFIEEKILDSEEVKHHTKEKTNE